MNTKSALVTVALAASTLLLGIPAQAAGHSPAPSDFIKVAPQDFIKKSPGTQDFIKVAPQDFIKRAPGTQDFIK